MATLLYYTIATICSLQSFLAIIFIAGLILRVKRKKLNVCIVVLGDIGRSPRMQYHAKSLISEGYTVSFVGYAGTSPIKVLKENNAVSFFHLSQWKWNFLPGFLNYIAKATFMTLQLFYALSFKVSIPSFYLVQNPPSVPSLLTVWLMTCLNGATMITDWHNYGFTILSMNLKNSSHILVRFSKWYEGFFGHFSHKNICVTKAMKSDLKMKWNVEAETLYDKPPDHFKEISASDQKADLFKKLIDSGCFDEFKNHQMWETLDSLSKGNPISVTNPAVIISSTSWTEDEDFSILLEALKLYEEKKNQIQPNLPKIICIITGKGPLKEFYKEKIQKMKFRNILITTPWLEAEDYPKVIGCGDLGISLHYSSSGLDLPMKVVDMFGCCLPVCAISFSCLNELVKHGINGLTFSDANELSLQIVDLFSGFPQQKKKLEEMRSNLRNNFAQNRWHENWKKVVLPLLQK